jgi:hypothetical protein
VALTEKPADEAAANKATDGTEDKDRAAAAAVQLELQQAVAQRAAALEADDVKALRDADSTLSGLVGRLGKK